MCRAMTLIQLSHLAAVYSKKHLSLSMIEKMMLIVLP